MKESNIFWLLTFVLFGAGAFVVQAFEMLRRRIKKLERRIEKLESAHPDSADRSIHISGRAG